MELNNTPASLGKAFVLFSLLRFSLQGYRCRVFNIPVMQVQYVED